MSAPVRGRRPSRFTFNIPSPAHSTRQQPRKHDKHPQHPAPPPSFLSRKQQDGSRRRKVSTPHPIATKPSKASTLHPLLQHKKASFVDYSLSLHFSPSFSPSSCVISGVSLPNTPTSRTDSPTSDMLQRRWSVEMRRDSNDDDDEQEDDDEEEEEEGEEQNIMSPDVLSSSSCSFFSDSSLDTPVTSPPASYQPPQHRQPSSSSSPAPTASAALPHRRVNSDPLPTASTSSVSSLAFKLNLRPLAIPASRADEAIIMLSALSPIPLCQLTDRQQSFEYDEQPNAAGSSAGAGVDELLHGRPMTLAECWYGRSELMSPVNGAAMMHMAAQQMKSRQLPFTSFLRPTPSAIL